MKTLVVCPTYGRIPFLNRMLASFLSQTHQNKHLVIVNDDVHVELCCDHIDVTCINLNKKILLPQKRNLAIGLGYYDLIFQHDDDDIFLPSRLANHVVKHIENPGIWYYRNEASYVISEEEIIVGRSSPTACSYTRRAWFEVGGYAHPQNAGEDQEFIGKMKNTLIENIEDKIDFVYNWGGINYHTSHSSDQNTDEIAHRQLEELNLVGKKYWIEPDFKEYNKFLILDTLYKHLKTPLKIKHTNLAELDISHLM